MDVIPGIRHRRAIACILVTLCVLTGRNAVAYGEIDSECLKLLRSEGTAAWDRHASAFDGITFTGQFVDTLRYVDGAGNPQELNRNYTFTVRRLVNQHCVLVEQQQSDGLATVKGLNPDYRFELDRQQREGDWLLSKAGTPSKSPELPSNDHYWDRYAWEIEGGISLKDILTRSDAFRLDEVTCETSSDGYRLVHLKATNIEQSDTGMLGVPGAVYAATVSAQFDWAIQRFHVRYPPKNGHAEARRSGEIEYYVREDEPPFVRKITMTVARGGQTATPEQTTTVELQLPKTFRDTSSFYLPHYGIDDDVLRSDSRGGIRRIMWFLLGVAALAVFWRLIRGKPQSAA